MVVKLSSKCTGRKDTRWTLSKLEWRYQPSFALKLAMKTILSNERKDVGRDREVRGEEKANGRREEKET